ncbi:LPXTG cell wall anchor domain-containing protein [Streptomyces sp. CoH27]|uniref:LPXTG cell wall anchor domain-containing protein n=1 Tax=Streptomyces sp. CoH27 TaxID=2875763 RepID=UPI001CD1B36E|nr:LPXTG cell wall anchor domain-containing protein [Streptomyces sp. CoH27]
MKLRRAMVTAAATAVIAPIALLSAPAAFADESPTASVSSSPSDSSSPTADDSSSPTDSVSPSDSASESSSATPSDSASTSASASPSGSASTSASASPTQSAAPTAEPSDCPVDGNMVDPDSQLSIDISGLPGKIVAGSGWHYFTMTAANHSDQSLGTVQWLATVDNDTASDNEKDWLSTYAKLEYFNPKTKAWESMADEVGNGLYFGTTPLGPKEKVGIKLRVDITAQAPAGDGFSMGFGGYVDQQKNCVHSAFGFYDFTVLKPGSSNPNPGQAKPGKGTKPAGGKEPQGGATEIEPTGTLAHTGSSSMLPTIGLVGGVAVVVGAGAVFAVRRRKGAGSDAAA